MSKPEIVEVIRFRVPAERAEAFVQQRATVDAEVRQLAGYRGAELIHLSGEDWLLLVYWATRADVEAAQQITETLPVITAWTSLAAFVSFDTADLRYSTRP